jgi:hypothetical protein
MNPAQTGEIEELLSQSKERREVQLPRDSEARWRSACDCLLLYMSLLTGSWLANSGKVTEGLMVACRDFGVCWPIEEEQLAANSLKGAKCRFVLVVFSFSAKYFTPSPSLSCTARNSSQMLASKVEAENIIKDNAIGPYQRLLCSR